MVRRRTLLGVLFILLLLPAVAEAAPSPLRLRGSFTRSSYVPNQAYRFALTVVSRTAQTNARASFVILAKPAGGKTLQARTVTGLRLRKGSTRLAFSGRLRAARAVDGIYPVTVSVTAGGATRRLRSNLIVVDPKRHGKMLVALVWSVVATPTVSPRGIYWSRGAPGLVRGGRNPGYLTMHVRKIERYPRVRVSLDVMPETLLELLGVVRGFRLRDGRKIVQVRGGSPESGDGQAFFSQTMALMRAGRVEPVPSPFAYPALPELAARGWRDDVRLQISQGQDIVERALGSASTPGMSTPGLRLPASVVPLYRRAGVDYTVVGRLGGLDSWRVHGVRGESGAPLKVAIADETGARILTGSPPAAAVEGLIAHLARVRLVRARRPTASVLVLAGTGGWRASPELVERLYRALSQTGWIRTVTVGGAVSSTYAGVARARLPVQQAAKGLKPYYARVADARRNLSTYARMAKPNNPALRRLERNVLIAESALWINGGAAGRKGGLVFAEDVTRTVAGQMAKISIPGSQTITLPSQSGKVPVTVTNGGRYDVRVSLALSGSNTDFPEGRTVNMELKPGDNYVTFPVIVRTGSDSTVLVRMLGGGQPLGRSVVRVKTTYFSRMMFLAAVMAALLGLLVVIYRKAGAANGR